MTDLYVAPGGAYPTIPAAAAAASPGTVIHVAQGTYAGGFETAASGTSSAQIIYVCDAPMGCVVRGGGATGGGEAVMWRQAGSYTTMSGFLLDGSSSPQIRALLYVTGGNNIISANRFQSLLTDPAQFAAQQGSGGGAVTLADYYQGSKAFGNHVLGNVILNVGPPGATSSTVHSVYNDSQSTTLSDNCIIGSAGAGIHNWGDPANAIVQNNTVLSAKMGILVGGSGAVASGMTVSKNIVANNKYGISEQGSTGAGNTYSGNLTWNDGAYEYSLQTGIQTGGISADPMLTNATTSCSIAAASPAIPPGIGVNGAGTSLSAPKPAAAPPPVATATPVATDTATIPTGEYLVTVTKGSETTAVTINGFVIGSDVLKLSGFGATPTIADSTAGVVISTDGSTITLDGVHDTSVLSSP